MAPSRGMARTAPAGTEQEHTSDRAAPDDSASAGGGIRARSHCLGLFGLVSASQRRYFIALIDNRSGLWSRDKQITTMGIIDEF